VSKYGLLLLLVGVCILGCGVKGDPLPPENPPVIGRGYPTFRKATERLQIRTEPTEDEEAKKKEEQED